MPINPTKFELMKNFKRIFLIVFIFLMGFIAYTFKTTGFFRYIENQFDGEIRKEIPVKGAEDITASSIDSFALISATNRIVYPPGGEEFGGLYYMELKSEDFNIKPLTPFLSTSFAPHGISMIKTDSTYRVMAINHTPEGNSIEVFTLIRDSLSHISTMTDPSMISPNDLVMLDENSFYFTNDHRYTKGIGLFIEEYAGRAISNVVYFDGENYREVANGIAYANGINFDPKRNLMFVASPRGFLIKVYSKNENGSLTSLKISLVD